MLTKTKKKSVVRLKTAAWISALLLPSLLSWNAEKLGGLKEIAKPYLGGYECTDARLGGRDLAERFDELRLELEKNGTYRLICAKEGERKTVRTGNYRYDEKENAVVLYAEYKGKTRKKSFPLKNGAIEIKATVNRKLLYLRFEKS